MNNMKKIISIFILSLIAISSFAQNKYILKVASGGTVDLSGIYTKTQIDSINATRNTTASNGVSRSANDFQLGGTLNVNTSIGLGTYNLYIGQNLFTPNTNTLVSNDGINGATISNNGSNYNTVIKNSVQALGYGVVNQIVNDINGIAIKYHSPFDNTGTHPQTVDSSNSYIALNGSGIQTHTGGQYNIDAKGLYINTPFWGKYVYDSLLNSWNPLNNALGSLVFNTNRNGYQVWSGKTWRPISRVINPDEFNFNDDYGNIQHALSEAVDGDVIQLNNKVYTLERPIIIKKSITLRGSDSTIITRPNAEFTTLKQAADSNSTFIRVNDVSHFSEGDFLIVYSGNDWTASTEPTVVRKIGGDTLYVDTLHKYRGGTGTFAIGTKVLKSIGFILVGGDNTESTDPKSVIIENITFDGNKAGNTESYRYNVHMPILAETQKRTVIRGCKFINAPGESILGHNMDIISNIFKNNNGSIFHGSISKQWIDSNAFMTNIIGNISDSSNLVSTNISGHSEGILTTSNSGGFVNATQNRFLHIGSDAAVIGALYPSSTNTDWGTSNYNFSGNIVNGATRLVYLIDTTGGISGTDSLRNVYISDNLLYNVGYQDISKELKHWGRSVVINQKTYDERDSLVLTTTGTSGPATKVGNVLNIPNYAVSGGSPAWGGIIGSIGDQGDLIAKFDTKADLDSPDFTGFPTAPSQPANSNNVSIANTYYVDRAVSALPTDASVVHKTGDETIANTKTFTGTYFGLPNIIDLGSGLNFVRQAGDGNLYKRSQSDVINDLGISAKADDSNTLHKTGDESASGNKILTGAYLGMPNLTDPAGSGLNFIRQGGDGTLYYRSQASTITDLGIDLKADQSALQDTAAAIRSSFGTGSGDMLKSVYDPTSKNTDAFNYNNLYNKPSVVSAFTNDAGYITTPDLPLVQNQSIKVASATGNKLYFGTYNDAGLITFNRDGATGAFADPTKAASYIYMGGSTGSSYVSFGTTTANNTNPSERMRIDGDGQIYMNVMNNVSGGDFVTRNNGSGVLNIRTSAQTLSDIGAEPAFSKNTGFNKNFGRSSGTVVEGQEFIDSLAAINARLGSGGSGGSPDTIYTKGFIHVLDSAGVKQYVYGDSASATKDGGLLKEDWIAFNAKQNALSGTGLVRMSGATVSYDNTAYAPLASPTFTGTVTSPAINLSGQTASTIASLDASKNVVSLPVATYPSLTELSYVKGLTSAVQTQITAKAPLASPAFTGNPTATTQTSTDNSTKLATTAFVQTSKLVVINAQTGTTYTSVLADGQKLVTMNNASANTFTVPTNATVAYPIGTQINITQTGAGQTSIVATGGVTIQSPGGALKLRVQYSTATLVKTATNTWILMGDISL